MDGSRFDSLARTLAASGSRRRVVGGLLGGALGLGGLSGVTAAGLVRGLGQTCRENANCVAGATCQRTPSGRRVCACGGATPQLCNGTCVAADACRPRGSACAADGQCSSGTCNSFYHACYECLPANNVRFEAYCDRDADCCPGLTCDPFSSGGSGNCS